MSPAAPSIPPPLVRVFVLTNVNRAELTMLAPNTCVSPNASIDARRFRNGRNVVWIVMMLWVSASFGGRRSNASKNRAKIEWLAFS